MEFSGSDKATIAWRMEASHGSTVLFSVQLERVKVRTGVLRGAGSNVLVILSRAELEQRGAACVLREAHHSQKAFLAPLEGDRYKAAGWCRCNGLHQILAVLDASAGELDHDIARHEAGESCWCAVTNLDDGYTVCCFPRQRRRADYAQPVARVRWRFCGPICVC